MKLKYPQEALFNNIAKQVINKSYSLKSKTNQV